MVAKEKFPSGEVLFQGADDGVKIAIADNAALLVVVTNAAPFIDCGVLEVQSEAEPAVIFAAHAGANGGN